MRRRGDEHPCDEDTSPSPVDEIERRLRELKRLAKENELARRLAKDRRRGSRDD